jgi:misacylated tRNA(Ala) deacylase
VLAGLGPGDAVTAHIDWERRHRHMRFHTATHLLCAIIPHQTNGCSITAEYARLDFDMTEPLDREHLERELARLVAGEHAVGTVWITDEELDAKPTWCGPCR